MSYLSGQPLYCYELCLELKRQGHDVTMISEWILMLTEAGKNLRDGLVANGIKCLDKFDKYDQQDLIIASELSSQKVIEKQPDTPVIVVVHSEFECETPIPDKPQILNYVCIRPNILDHIVNEHNIPRSKCVVIYNGVDRERFKKRKKSKRNYHLTVVPCTLDTMREAFLNKLIDEADEKHRVAIFGMDCGAKLHENPYAVINKDKFNIEEDIANADEVAGILLGRVNLEAWSCGVPSRIYDPVTLENRLYDPPLDFDRNHNIKTVASKMVDLVGNLDDITVVIPHYSARPQLARLLESIKTMRNVVVCKGGSFAHNCNKGVKCAETKYVLLTNDDTSFNPIYLLRRMMTSLKTNAIVGARPSKGCKGFEIIDGKVTESETPTYPSGALFMMKKEDYWKVGGLDERFVNGAEDIDLYLRAKDMGWTVAILDDVYLHDCGVSEGRYNFVEQNINLFNKIWKGKYTL